MNAWCFEVSLQGDIMNYQLLDFLRMESKVKEKLTEQMLLQGCDTYQDCRNSGECFNSVKKKQ